MRRWKEESEEGGLLRRGRLIDGGALELPLQAPESGPRRGMGRRRDGNLADNAGVRVCSGANGGASCVSGRKNQWRAAGGVRCG
jgi:hypothetical protein